jgi:phage-related minor tail protein
MTDNRKIQLEAEVSDNTKAGFDSIKRGAADMGQAVVQSTAKASDAVGKIGDGSDGAAQKLDKSTRSIIGSVERATAALNAGERGTAKYFEALANQRGANVDVLKPYIEQLKQAELAQQAASGSLNRIGVSAGQTAAALRSVPAQFTDIITSLQGGQAPLTVLLQQGGQLKDLFGGVGEAARALGGYIIGLVNPLTVTAAALGAIALAYGKGSAEADAYNKALILTGNASGSTAGQLQAYALQISAVVGTQGKAAEAVAAFAASGRVGNESLREFAQTAVQFERATGTAIDETVKKFVELRNAPLAASLKLNEGTNFLTESLYRQIKALEDQGRATEAASLAQKAFNDAQTDRAAEITKNLGSIERGWLSIKDAIKGAADAALSVGRGTSDAARLADVQAQIATSRNRIANGQQIRGGFIPLDGPERASEQRRLDNLEAEAAKIQKRTEATLAGAAAERQRAEAVQASVAFDKAGEKFIGDRVKFERDLAEAVNTGVAAGRSQAEILARINAIRDDYAKKNKGAVAEENKELARQNVIFSELAGVTTTYYKELATAQAERAKGVLTEAQYVDYVEKLIQKQPFAVALAKEEAEAIKQRRKAEEESLKISNDALEVRQKSADTVQAQVQRLKDEAEASVIAARGNITLAQALEEVALARLQNERDQQRANGADDATLAAIDKEIAARRELIGLVGSKDAREANTKAAKDAADEWKRSAESISNSLTDALLRGFESGKGFLRNLVDTVKNLFQTLVLRPQIQAVFGLGGASGAAQAAAGGSGSGFSPGSITSLFGGNSIGVGVGNGLVSTGNFLVSAGFDKFGAAVSSFADSAASFSNFAYSGAGLAGSLIGNAIFGGKGLSGIGGSLGSIGGLALSGAGGALAGSTIGAALGSALPVVGTILGGLAGSFIGSLFGSKPPPFKGGSFQAQADGPGFVPTAAEQLNSAVPGIKGTNDFIKRAVPALNDATKTLATGLQTTLTDILDSFGKEAGDVFVAFRSNGKKAKGNINIGGELSSFSTGTNDPQKAFEQFTDFASRSVLTALNSAGLPQFAKDLLAEVSKTPGLEALQTVAQTISQIVQVTKALRDLPFANIKTISEDSVIALAKLTGGLSNLNDGLAAYYAAFYTDAERTTEARAQLTKSLAAIGVAIPSTREAFRALVNAQDLTTEAGRKMYAQLIALAPAFASVTDETSKVVEAKNQFNAAVASVTDGLVGEAQRIRGLLGTGGQSFAEAQAQFAVATASARAGNQDAAKSLPGLSQQLLGLAEQSATSATQLALLRATTAASLDTTAAALSAALGVPFQASAPVSVSSIAAPADRSTTDDTLAALKSMQAELAAMRALALRTEQNTRKTADTLVRVSADGDSLLTTTA